MFIKFYIQEAENYIDIYACIYMYVCVYIYTHIHIHSILQFFLRLAGIIMVGLHLKPLMLNTEE